MKRYYILLTLLLLPLHGCLEPESEFWRIPAPAIPAGGGGGGGGGPAPAAPRPAPTMAPPIDPVTPMLQDPEGQQSSVSDYVWAADEAEAEQKCRNLSERWGNEYSRVERSNNWQNQAGKYRYTCFMTNYGDPRYGATSDDNSDR